MNVHIRKDLRGGESFNVQYQPRNLIGSKVPHEALQNSESRYNLSTAPNACKIMRYCKFIVISCHAKSSAVLQSPGGVVIEGEQTGTVAIRTKQIALLEETLSRVSSAALDTL
jgi:hypothetical protein